MAVELRSRIQAALHRCGDRAFAERARELLAALGYRSEKTFAIEPNTAEGFRELLAAAGRAEDFNPTRALADQWRSVDLLFQLTAAELAVPSQMTLAFRETAGWQAGLYPVSYTHLTLPTNREV